MKYDIWDRRTAERYSERVPVFYIHVGAYNPEDKPPKLGPNPNRKGELFLPFDDAEPQHAKWGNENKWVFMDENHAKQILAFIEQYKDEVELVIFQCDAGRSRSAGMAAGCCAVYGWNDDHAYAYPRIPNSHVKTLLIKIAGLNQDR